MSKKNRYKFRDRDRAAAVVGSAAVSASPVRANGADATSQHTAEYRVITKDLIRLIVLNGIMLAAVLVLYYTNRSSGYLEKIFQRFM